MHNSEFEHSFYLVHHHPLGVGGCEGGCQGQGQPGKRQEAWKREEDAFPSWSPISMDVLLDPNSSRLNYTLLSLYALLKFYGIHYRHQLSLAVF